MASTLTHSIVSGLLCLVGLVLVLTGLNIIPGAATSPFPNHILLALGGMFALPGLIIVGPLDSTIVKLATFAFIGLFTYLFVWLTLFAPAALADEAVGLPRPYNLWIFRSLSGIGVLVGAIMFAFALRRFIADLREPRKYEHRKLISNKDKQR